MSIKIKSKLCIQMISIYYWFTFLLNADSYYVPYLVVGIIGSICCYVNIKEKGERGENTREKNIYLLVLLYFRE